MKKSNINQKIGFCNNRSKESYIIDNVAYVGQNNSIFCSYACHTMIFNYRNRELKLDDFIFNSGVGYSLSYSNNYLKYFPISGTFLSQWPSDREFLAKLYGLEYENWIPDLSHTIYEIWNMYWKKIKTYVKNDMPISTAVDVLSLPSTRKLMDDSLRLNTKKIPNFAWKLLSTAHEILIVGFDEEKRKIYYNDPVAEALGNSKEGNYATVSFEDFVSAVMNIINGTFNPKFILNTYIEKERSLPSEEIFKKCHERNIEKLKGNPGCYDSYWTGYSFGLNALKSIIKEFEDLSKNKSNELLSIYRLNSIKLVYMKKILQLFSKKNSSLLQNDLFANIYDIIAIEKKQILDYLRNKSSECMGEISLLNEEIKKWEKVSNFYSRFYKEFILLTRNDKVKKINENLISNISEIVDIEKRIIDIYKKNS